MLRQVLCTTAIGVLLSLAVPAWAQLGFGIGAGNWGGWGNNFGTWFGVSLWPSYRPTRPYSPTPRPTPESPQPQANGVVQGIVKVQSICPANTACPLMPNTINNVTVTAQPNGSGQWIAVHPTSQGYYQFNLPPGNYTLSATHPDSSTTQKPARVILIQPYQTQQQDFQLTVPLQ